MKLLVFGKTGQISRALQRAAPARGVSIQALDRGQADITDCQAVSIALAGSRADLVVNAAAYTAVDRAESDAEAAFAVNEIGPANIAAACAAHKLPLIHFSTDYVFDGRKAEPYIEDDSVNPLGVYGKSKLAGEVAVRALCPRHLILRTSWVHDAEGHNFVRTMLGVAGERKELSVVDDQLGCPTAAFDLAELVLSLIATLQSNNAPWGTYHAAGTGVTTWYGFAREIFRLRRQFTGIPELLIKAVPTSGYPTLAPRPMNSALDCTKLYQVFRQTLPPWQESLSSVVAAILKT